MKSFIKCPHEIQYDLPTHTKVKQHCCFSEKDSLGPPSSPASRAQRAHCQGGRSWTRTENRPSQPRSRELQRAGACLLSHQNRTGQTLAKFARNGGCRALAAPAEAAAGVVTVPAQRTIRHENQAGLVRRGAKASPQGRVSGSGRGRARHGPVASGIGTRRDWPHVLAGQSHRLARSRFSMTHFLSGAR